MSETALEIRGVAKRYAAHVAVRDLSLTVPAGAVYGLLGPNGAGKTTTIRMILNIIAPDEGTIRVLGRPNTETAVLDRLGYLPEEAASRALRASLRRPARRRPSGPSLARHAASHAAPTSR